MKMPFLRTLEVRGFVSGEVDFAALFNRKSPDQKVLMLRLAKCLFNASTHDGKFCSITVAGHSDRDDTPGLSDKQRRINERDRSNDRARSASVWLFERVREQFGSAGLRKPDSVLDVKNTSILPVVCGAGDLTFLQPGDRERSENRRVAFSVWGQDIQEMLDMNQVDVIPTTGPTIQQ